MKTIGIIGSGDVGSQLARAFTSAGYQVVLSNRRGPESLTDLITELGSRATAATVQEAAKQSIVLLAVRWENVEDVLSTVPEWNDTILIDVTNQMGSSNDIAELRGSEKVAKLAPGAHVVKAFNTLYRRYMLPITDKGHRVLFYAGDEVDIKSTLNEIFANMGYSPIDLGNLHQGNQLMEFDTELSGTHFIEPDED